MKKRIVTMGVLVLVMLALMMAGCDILFDKEKQFENDISATTLTFNTWKSDQLTADNEKWYKFTATVDEQYIHVSRGTLGDFNIQLCDSTGEAVGGEKNFYSWSALSFTVSVIEGNSYYLKVWPMGSGSGTYKIAFNETTASPDIWAKMDSASSFAFGTWTNGQLNANEDDWYKFTATTGTQWFHIERGTLGDFSVQLRDDEGNELGSENFYSWSNTSFNWGVLISGSVYYLRIQPSGSGSGTYSIALSTSSTPPAN